MKINSCYKKKKNTWWFSFGGCQHFLCRKNPGVLKRDFAKIVLLDPTVNCHKLPVIRVKCWAQTELQIELKPQIWTKGLKVELSKWRSLLDVKHVHKSEWCPAVIKTHRIWWFKMFQNEEMRKISTKEPVIHKKGSQEDLTIIFTQWLTLNIWGWEHVLLMLEQWL